MWSSAVFGKFTSTIKAAESGNGSLVKNIMFCFAPFSRRVKFGRSRPATRCPEPSFTVTGTWTKLSCREKVNNCCCAAGAPEGFWPGASVVIAGLGGGAASGAGPVAPLAGCGCACAGAGAVFPEDGPAVGGAEFGVWGASAAGAGALFWGAGASGSDCCAPAGKVAIIRSRIARNVNCLNMIRTGNWAHGPRSAGSKSIRFIRLDAVNSPLGVPTGVRPVEPSAQSIFIYFSLPTTSSALEQTNYLILRSK